MQTKPVAFVSYAHVDDEYDNGNIMRLAKRIEGAVRVFTGRSELEVFFDRKSIAWGDQWRARIAGGLSGSAILIAVVTPQYFASEACRNELLSFLSLPERKRSVLPIYYIEVPDEFGCDDRLAKLLWEQQYEDWRMLRTNARSSQKVLKAIERLAKRVRDLLASERTADPSDKRVSIVESDSSNEFRAHSTLFDADEDDALNCALAAQAALDDDEYGLARALLFRGLERFPKDAVLHTVLATVDWYDGALTDAVSSFELAITLGADRLEVLGSLGQVRVEMGDFERGIRELSQVITKASTNKLLAAYARSTRALAFGGLRRYEQALEELAQVELMTPNNAWLHFNRARVLDWQGKKEACASYIRSLVVNDPSLNRPKRLFAQTRLAELSLGG